MSISARTQKILITVLVCILLTGAAFGALLFGGYLSPTGTTEAPPPYIEPTPTQTEPLSTTQEVLLREKTAKPERIRGIWLEIAESTSHTAENTDKLLATAAKLPELGFNALFLDLGTLPGPAGGMVTATGSVSSSPLRSLLRTARSLGLYTVIRTEVWEKGVLLEDAAARVAALCEGYDADCLLFGGLEPQQNSVSEDILALCGAAAQADPALSLGLCLSGTAGQSASAEQTLRESMRDSRLKYLYYEAATLQQARTQALLGRAKQLAVLAFSEGEEFWCGYRADLLLDSDLRDPAAELTEQLLALASQEGCGADVLRAPALLKDSPSANAAMLLEFLKTQDPLATRRFSVTNQSKTTITTNNSSITFSGTSSPAHSLSCNGKEVERLASGDFSVELNLKPGENKVRFRHKGEVYTYTANYKLQLIKRLSPGGTVNAPGGTELEIKVSAHRSATVTATVNGKKIQMKKSSMEDGLGQQRDGEDFVTFLTTYKLPAGKNKKQNLGKIQITAQLNTLNETREGAGITIAALPPPPPPTQPVPGPDDPPPPRPGSQYTPYAYNGVSGKSRMCEITEDYVETLPLSPMNDTSVPLNTPLLKGTFDYVVGEASFETYTYYILGSGRRIYQKEAKLIASGYNLPLNQLSVLSCESNSRNTRLVLETDWKVAFNSVIAGQSYKPKESSFSGRPYEVSTFTGTSLDITFYYTRNATGALDFSGSNVIKSAEWIRDTKANTATLRLNFREKGKFYGYSVSYDANGNLVLLVNQKPGNSLQGYTILLNPGHGGPDPGAICAVSSNLSFRYEKQLNLAIAKKTQEKLTAEGATVLMTRNADTDGKKEDVRMQTRATKPDLFISIHCDSSTSGSARGTSAFYYTPYSFPLADAIHKRLVSVYKEDIYRGKPQDILNRVDRNTAFYPFEVVRIEECPAILIEYGFVSNLEECAILQNEENQEKLAEATLQGIQEYVSAY